MDKRKLPNRVIKARYRQIDYYMKTQSLDKTKKESWLRALVDFREWGRVYIARTILDYINEHFNEEVQQPAGPDK